MKWLDVFSVAVLSNFVFANQYHNNKAFPILVLCSNSSLNHTCMKEIKCAQLYSEALFQVTSKTKTGEGVGKGRKGERRKKYPAQC